MEHLVRRARRHDREAFQDLMLEHAQGMYKVAKAILKNDEDVADAMQETALTCWERIETLKQENYFKTWMIRILINHCYAIFRQRRNEIYGETIPEAWAREENYCNVEWKDFLNCLGEKYRVVVILYYVQGFKTREIAEILKINESTVRSRLAGAREKMERQYNRRTSAVHNRNSAGEKLRKMAEQ